MVEASELDTDIIKKKIGTDFKGFIKAASNDYIEKLKSEMSIGFQKYYEELNKKVEEELLHQETQQKALHDKIDNYQKSTVDIISQINKIKRYNSIMLDKLPEIRRKALVFRFLVEYISERKKYKKNKKLVKLIYVEKIKRKCLNGIKKITLLEQTNVYDVRIKQKTQNELKNLQDGLHQQKEDLLSLIFKAEEKLKHENRKKVQTKLQLDQIVLRGISALNMKALSLSQNSLNDVMKTDYSKAIDKKYSSLIFPETKSTLNSKKIIK